MVAVLGWLLPGMGHWAMGQRRRGGVIGLTLVGLFVMGMAIGGIDVVDPKRDTIWFIPQAGLGPLGVGAGLVHGVLDKRSGQDPAPREQAYQTSIGRVNEMGTLYCAVAGVLNLLAILDAVHRQIDREAAPA